MKSLKIPYNLSRLLERRCYGSNFPCFVFFFCLLELGCHSSHRTDTLDAVKTRIGDSLNQNLEREITKDHPEGDHWAWNPENNSYEHRIYHKGQCVFLSTFLNGSRLENELLPVVVEDFFFEDKFYAKVQFFLDFEGDIKMKVRDVSEYQLIPIEERIYQLVINDALDLNQFEIEMEYKPSISDSLVFTRYIFKHAIYETN